MCMSRKDRKIKAAKVYLDVLFVVWMFLPKISTENGIGPFRLSG